MPGKLLLVLTAGLLLGADDKKDDLKKMEGVWEVGSIEQGGKKSPEDKIKEADLRLHITGNKFIYKAAGQTVMEGTFEIGSDKNPKTLDVKGKDPSGKEEKTVGIYQMDGDTMRVCFVPEGSDRPAKFETKEGTKAALIVYKRVKK
jgi:uncharacterized protein (TIGR03067 family)